MSRDTYLATTVHQTLLDAVLESWKDEIEEGVRILTKGLPKKFRGFKFDNQAFKSKRPCHNLGYTTSFSPFGYVAVFPDGTEETLYLLGHYPVYDISESNMRINVSWEDVPLLEELSQAAVLVNMAGRDIVDLPLDKIKKECPWILKLFDAAYESWRSTYRCTQELAAVLGTPIGFDTGA